MMMLRSKLYYSTLICLFFSCSGSKGGDLGKGEVRFVDDCTKELVSGTFFKCVAGKDLDHALRDVDFSNEWISSDSGVARISGFGNLLQADDHLGDVYLVVKAFNFQPKVLHMDSLKKNEIVLSKIPSNVFLDINAFFEATEDCALKIDIDMYEIQEERIISKISRCNTITDQTPYLPELFLISCDERLEVRLTDLCSNMEIEKWEIAYFGAGTLSLKLVLPN